MKLSVTSWSFPACTLHESWAIAQALGFGAIDIGLFYASALDKARVLATPEDEGARLRATGVRAANLYWLFGQGLADRALSEPGAEAANAADFLQVCRFARAAGATSIFVLPGVTRPGLTREDGLHQSMQAARGLLSIAQAHGVILTVEPHIGGLLASPADTLAYLDGVPGLKLALDHAHFIAMGFPQEKVDVLIPHAGHVHLRQARPGALQAKWGEGTIDFGQVFDALKSAEYSGYLAVEYVHQSYMNTLFDDVLTETVRMRDLAHSYGIS
jgi:sugar phosphate isomerase/epimerase